MHNYDEVMRMFDRGYQHALEQQRAGKLDMFSAAADSRTT